MTHINMGAQQPSLLLRLHDTQYDDNQHNDTQYDDDEHKDTQAYLYLMLTIGVMYVECRYIERHYAESQL